MGWGGYGDGGYGGGGDDGDICSDGSGEQESDHEYRNICINRVGFQILKIMNKYVIN